VLVGTLGGTVEKQNSLDIGERLTRLKDARHAFQSIPKERYISAMPVVVHYAAHVGEARLVKRGGDFVFAIDSTVSGGDGKEWWEEVRQDAFAIRDAFLKLETPSEALDFLSKTGQFSPLHATISWKEFQRWQHFAYLIMEHSQLASVMNNGQLTGECAEALKALSGIYDSSFFDVPEADFDISSRVSLEHEVNRHPEIRNSLQESELKMTQRRRELWSWFRQPNGNACSIEWIPTNERPRDDELIRKLQAGGAMIEYLVNRDRLRPVFLVRPSYTLQAIAAAIFADRANGVEYRQCELCKDLFRVGSHKNKLYCDKKSCKNTAHQRRKRANARERELKKGHNKPRTARAADRAGRK
jgi:hypothetical protein